MGTPYGGLPTELFHHIFDTLYYDDSDLATLKACSLVDRQFCALSQMRLLSRVILRQDNIYPSISILTHTNIITPAHSPALDLFQVLDTSPHIASYIQSLTIQCDWIFMGPTMVVNADHCVRTDTVLAILLQRLISLRRFSVSQRRAAHLLKRHHPRPWTTVSQGLTTVFFTQIPSHALTDLNVTGISLFPVHLLRHCPSLKRLSISSLQFDPQEPSTIDEINPHPQLDCLRLEDLSDLGNWAEWFSVPSFPLDVSRLRELCVLPSQPQDVEEIALCSAWAKTITHLRIDSERAVAVSTSYNTLKYILYYHSAPIPDLNALDYLEHVVVDAMFTIRTFHHRTLIDYITSPLPWIASLFTALAQSPSGARITHLVLNLAFFDFSIEIAKLLIWKPLANAFNKFSRSPKLRLNITGLDSDAMAEVRRDEFLVGLAERVILN